MLDVLQYCTDLCFVALLSAGHYALPHVHEGRNPGLSLCRMEFIHRDSGSTQSIRCKAGKTCVNLPVSLTGCLLFQQRTQYSAVERFIHYNTEVELTVSHRQETMRPEYRTPPAMLSRRSYTVAQYRLFPDPSVLAVLALGQSIHAWLCHCSARRLEQVAAVSSASSRRRASQILNPWTLFHNCKRYAHPTAGGEG